MLSESEAVERAVDWPNGATTVVDGWMLPRGAIDRNSRDAGRVGGDRSKTLHTGRRRHSHFDVIRRFAKLEAECAAHGLYAAGFISYEASRVSTPGFARKSLKVLQISIVWFAFTTPCGHEIEGEAHSEAVGENTVWQTSIDDEPYREAFAHLRN